MSVFNSKVAPFWVPLHHIMKIPSDLCFQAQCAVSSMSYWRVIQHFYPFHHFVVYKGGEGVEWMWTKVTYASLPPQPPSLARSQIPLKPHSGHSYFLWENTVLFPWPSLPNCSEAFINMVTFERTLVQLDPIVSTSDVPLEVPQMK